MDDELKLDWGGRKSRAADEPQPPAETEAKSRGLPPWHPDALPEGLRYRVGGFFTDDFLRVSQAVEMAQAIVGWDQANVYDVKGADARTLFLALEESGGLLGSLSRNFNPFYRNKTECMTSEGSLFLRCTFPFTWFFRRCEVEAWSERPIGTVQTRFNPFKFRADIVGTTGNVLLEVHGPVFKFLSFTDWVFEVRKGKQVVARIKKHWGGFFREAFTQSDRFTVQFEPGLVDARSRLLIFAAALTVDAAAFEKKDRHLGGNSLTGNVLGLLD